jgi:hypothetical protein
VSEAAKQGAVDPDAVFRLLDPEEIEYDDTGKPRNVADAVEALLAERTYLVASGGNDRPRKQIDQGPRVPNDSGQLSAEDAAKMSPEEIRNALREGKFTRQLAGDSAGD